MANSLNRIRMRDAGGGNEYTFSINPKSWDSVDSDDLNFMTVIDGAGIILRSNFDNRVRRMSWDNFSDSDTTYTGIVSEIKSYKGVLKEINFFDLDFLSQGWLSIRVLNVSTRPLDGGEFRYSLTLEYVLV